MAAPTVSIAGGSGTEGDDESITFTVTLDAAASATVTVDYATSDGSAESGDDYTAASGTLSIAAGETSKTISVAIDDDIDNESDETFTVTLSNASGADLGTSSATGTIRNRFVAAPTVSIAGGSGTEGDDESITFTVTLDAAPSATVTVDYATSDGSAESGDDYTAASGTLSIAAGETSKTISVAIDDDIDNESDETFTVTLSNASGADLGTSSATGTIRNRFVAPLTASFENMPAEHDGSTVFTFRLRFSEDPAVSYRVLRDEAFSVSGGTVKYARRVDGRDDLREIHVEPVTTGEIRISLPATTDCDTADAICTADGRGLSHSLSARVADPVGISVADARVEEAEGAQLAFAVTLERVASGTITMDYRTADGTATAGADYTATSGTLTFEAGDASQTVNVTVLDDSHNDGEETMTLRLSNASGGVLTDSEATGTIENSDPMPRAFMARFGRTAALHVVEQVQERIEARREPGIEARFAGRAVERELVRDLAVGFLSRLGTSAGTNRGGAGVPQPMSDSPVAGTGLTGAPTGLADGLGGGANPVGSMPGTDEGLNQRGHLGIHLGGGNMLTGSAFFMNRETRRGGILSFWSRGAQSQFAGREGELSLDGRVRTTMLGADYAKGPLVAGLSLSHSRGRGDYEGVDIGEVTSSVTGLYPWLGYKVTDRITLWGVTGYGKGALTLTPGAGTELQSGLSMALAAGGLRGKLADSVVAGFGLAFKADALWVSTGIEDVDGPEGRLAATSAAVTRYRTALEASRGYSFERGLSLQPSLEVGLRRDGGDAETGAGADIGGGLIVSDVLTGLSADVRVRMLLAHQDQEFRDRGVSIAFSYNPTPSSPLGLVAKVTPSWGGQAESGAQALWGQETMAGMAQGGGTGNRLEAELGYGLPVGSQLVGTPRFGIGTSEQGRDYRLGYGLTVTQRGAMSFDLGIDANRRESLAQGTAEHGVLGRLTARW